MRKIILAVITIIAFIACKNESKETSNTAETEVAKLDRGPRYNTPIAKTLKAHGSLETWDGMNNLCFSFEGGGGEEVHTVSLKNRNEKIENEKWSLGNDGNGVWLLENEQEAYKGNAIFYNQLMFYFYAMPFVLADDGIVYTPMPAQELDGKTYNAIKIGYEDAVGWSPKDEYILYSDPETNQMAWLGYTVTGNSNKKSDRWSFIKYGAWQEINGLQLPETLTWYKVEDNLPTEARNDRKFNKVTITKTILPASVFAKPEGAIMVTE